MIKNCIGEKNSMDERVKKLFIMQLKENGIPKDAELDENDRGMLEEREGKYHLKEEFREKLKVVLTGGVFDILHAGHIYTLAEAKKLGDVLVVAVARDEQVKKRKGREPVHSQEYRAMMVGALKPVDAAIPGFENPEKMLEYVKPSVIVYGYDQPAFMKPEGIETIQLEKHVEEGKFKTNKIIKNLGI